MRYMLLFFTELLPLLPHHVIMELYIAFCGRSCKKNNKKSVQVHDRNLGEETVSMVDHCFHS